MWWVFCVCLCLTSCQLTTAPTGPRDLRRDFPGREVPQTRGGARVPVLGRGMCSFSLSPFPVSLSFILSLRGFVFFHEKVLLLSPIRVVGANLQRAWRSRESPFHLFFPAVYIFFYAGACLFSRFTSSALELQRALRASRHDRRMAFCGPLWASSHVDRYFSTLWVSSVFAAVLCRRPSLHSPTTGDCYYSALWASSVFTGALHSSAVLVVCLRFIRPRRVIGTSTVAIVGIVGLCIALSSAVLSSVGLHFIPQILDLWLCGRAATPIICFPSSVRISRHIRYLFQSAVCVGFGREVSSSRPAFIRTRSTDFLSVFTR